MKKMNNRNQKVRKEEGRDLGQIYKRGIQRKRGGIQNQNQVSVRKQKQMNPFYPSVHAGGKLDWIQVLGFETRALVHAEEERLEGRKTGKEGKKERSQQERKRQTQKNEERKEMSQQEERKKDNDRRQKDEGRKKRLWRRF